MFERRKLGLLALLAAGVLFVGGCTTSTPETTAAPEPSASTPTASPTPTCAPLDGPAAAAEVIGQLPPTFEEPSMSHVAWDLGSARVDGYDPCAELSWIVFSVEGGTVSSPSQIALFHRGEFIGTATEKAYGFWPDVERVSDGEIEVTYRWPKPDEANAEASGRSVSVFTWSDGVVNRTGELPPD